MEGLRSFWSSNRVRRNLTLFLALSIASSVQMAWCDIELPPTATQADIQAALDSAGPGSTVILPEGTYDIASTLWVTNAVTLKGAGADKTFLRGSANLADYESLIYLNNKDAVVSQLTVRDVKRSKYWGFNAIGVQIRSGRFEWGRVTGCTSAAWNHCGAVSLHGADAVLSHSRIDHNTLTSPGNGGGGVMLEGGGVADNCLVDHNTALTYGGVYFRGAGKMVNCTVVGNTATTGTFGGIGTHASGVLVNTIARYNIASSATADISAGGTIRHCASSEGVGTDPVSADPEFTDAANEDYTLLVSSPCFNKGSQAEAESVIGVVEKDLAGGTRVMGAEIDIGCYEYDTSKAACAFAADTSETLIGNAVTLTASCSGFDGADDLVYTWLLTSASAAEPIERTGSPLEFNAEKPERYSVTLTVSSAMLGKEISATKENYFYVAPFTNYVTSAKVDTAVFPYATPETAATNVLDAVAAAIARSTVKLDAGRHDVSGEIQLIRAVTLVGAGRDETELYATSAFGNILKVNDAGALVSDLTVSHARGVAMPYTGVAVNILSNGGTLRRVRVTDCSSDKTYYITGIINMQSSAGRITHCQIDNCDIGRNGGLNRGGGAVYMTAGLIDNTVIADCYSTYYRSQEIDNGGGLTLAGGKAVNCTIVRNTLASSVGGGVCKRPGAILENCIVYDNEAPGDATDPEVTGAPNLGGSVENVSHCLVGQAVGTDPVAGEPAFMDAPNGDFRLAPNSPCRDIAEVGRYLELLGLDTIEGETDLDGMPRLSGAKIDVGAYEYDASKVSCVFSVDKAVAFVPATFTLTPSVEGFTDPEGATLTWTFEPVHGGEPIVVVQTGTNALCQVLSSNEQYRVSLAGAGAGQSGSFTRADPIYAAARTNYVTAAANPNCCFPYATPETAATNLADAVDASVDNATVFVGEGTNVVRQTVLIEKGIEVRGVARDRAWLRAPTAYGPLIRFNHADAVVADLTIANGQAVEDWKDRGSAAAVDFDAKGGTLAGCRVTECGLNRKGDGNLSSEVAALFLHGEKAVVTRCVVDNFDGIGFRTGGDYHCGGCGVIATAGRIDNSIISNVVGVTRGDFLGLALNIRGTAVALNCTVVSNSEYLAGGGVGVHALSTVQNTVSVDNFNSAGVESNIGGEEKCVCCLSPSFTSTANGNVVGRPVYREGSLVQKADSPGRNKGSVAGYEDVLFGGTDFYGKRRVKSPRRSAKAKIDIGCAESDPDGLLLLAR